jgi:pimeloyl-ACP methyl ester carboxylesterase
VNFTSAVTEGQKFVYEDSGTGPLVVLIHGFPDTPAGWADTRTALNAAGYRTVVPYLRGYHPDTIVPGRSYKSDDIADDALRLLDALGEERAVFVGHDWGASIVYRATMRSPERVRGVCGIGIPHPNLLKPTPKLAWGARHFLTLSVPTGTWLARRDGFAYIDTLMRRWAPNWSGPAREATLADVKAAFADPVVLEGALDYYRAINPRDKSERITRPGLIVGGTTDIAPAELFRQSPAQFDASCDVLIAEGAGHWPHREAAGLFHGRLLEFLETLD